jgi:hypothetical protein
MLELVRDFLRNRTTALSVLRGLAMGFGMYVMGHEAQFPDWVEVLVAVVNGGAFLATGNAKAPGA